VEDQKKAGTDVDEPRYDKIADLAVTAGGKGRKGKLSERTRTMYAKLWTEAEDWYRSTGRSLMPWSSDALAAYATHLLTSGYAPATVRKRLAAVKTRHRQLGSPVPDDVAAWFVLRAANHTPPTRTKVNPADRPIVAALAATCDLDTAAGRRDLCLITMVWDLLARPDDLVALDLSDVDIDGENLAVRFRYGTVTLDHDHDPPGICPVEAAAGWIAALAAAGVTAGPLFRPVDRFDTIGQPGVTFAGHLGEQCRLRVGALSRIWAVHVTRAGVPRCTPRALRVGGGRDDLARGAQISDVLRLGRWSPKSVGIVGQLLDQGGARS
jgi:integrase